jgi:hypothetical protein
MTITIENITYEVDNNDTDIILMSEAQDVFIELGYYQLRREGIGLYGRYIDDELYYSDEEIEAHIEESIEEYIYKNFKRGVVTANQD